MRDPGRATRVLVTAEGDLAAAISAMLEREGVAADVVPCIRVLPPPDPTGLAQAVKALHELDWLVVTSRNGARAFIRACRDAAVDPGQSPACVAVVGPSTATELTSSGMTVSLVPQKATAGALAEALAATGLAGRSVLLLHGTMSSPELAASLAAAGAKVTTAVAYTTVEGVEDPDLLRTRASRGELDVVTLASGSAARALASAIGSDAFFRLRLVCIGPATAEVVRELGVEPARIATPHTADGLVRAVIAELRTPCGAPS
jgi:uroporphyrinogen-III synthase